MTEAAEGDLMKPHEVREFFEDVLRGMVPDGCLPTPGQERRAVTMATIALHYATIHTALSRAEAERDEAVKALSEAHKIAVDRAFERDREADELYAKDLSRDGMICKMQGATAAVIANDILAVQQRLSRSIDTEKT